MTRPPRPTDATSSLVVAASTRSMLVGLSRSHPLVLAIDSRRRIVWMSDAMGLVFPGTKSCVGQPITDLIDQLASRADDGYRKQAEGFIAELHEKGSIAAWRFELGEGPVSAPVEASAFRFESEDGEMFSVCMARRLAPNTPLRPEPAPLDPNSRLAFILDATPDAVLVIDRLGFVTSANAAAGRILGRAPSDLIDSSFLQFVRESEQADRIARTMDVQGFVESEEVEVTLADGQRAWLSISARAHHFPRVDGTTARETIVLIRDVTARHVSSQALERKNSELENCVQSVSHDLRSPLSSLLGFTRLLRDDYEGVLGASGNRFLDRIEEAGHNMESLLHSLLELSRIGAQPLERNRIDPRNALLQIRSELKLALDEKRIELSIPANPAALFANPTQIYQLLSNLIGNSVAHRDATGEGFAPGRIDVEIEADARGVLIVVSDDGPGIDPIDQERIFEMFQTAGPPRPGKKRGGLGLAIVQKIVDAHEGTIFVESAVGAGARFIVHLPDPERDSSAPT